MDFKDYTVCGFIEDLSNDTSSPGGGSTAALVGALASSLNSMVYSFTVDKKSFEALSAEEKDAMRKFQKQSRDFSQLSLGFMEKDREYFMKLMKSYSLPKETEEEKEVRKNTIRENAIASMEIPLELAKISVKFYENIEFAVKHGNKNLTSDAIVAAILLHATIESAVVNVEINYNTLSNKEGFHHIPQLCKDIMKESEQRKTIITKTFRFF